MSGKRRTRVRDILSSHSFPLLFGHRGYSSRAPENTMASFRAAAEAGVPGVELDVHLCASGELVVAHDYNLKRVTGHDGVIERMSYGDIRALDAGSWFDARFAGERIPLLTDLFDAFGDSLYYDIEIKHKDRKPRELEEKLAAAIAKTGLTRNCVVSSFNPFALKTIREIAPDLLTAIIYCDDEEVPPILRHGFGKVISGCDILKPDRVKINGGSMAFHALFGGYPVIPWTVNDPGEAARLVKAGVWGIISDDPAAVAPATGKTLSTRK